MKMIEINHLRRQTTGMQTAAEQQSSVKNENLNDIKAVNEAHVRTVRH
jgi:hypothetical protein